MIKRLKTHKQVSGVHSISSSFEMFRVVAEGNSGDLVVSSAPTATLYFYAFRELKAAKFVAKMS